MYLLFLFSLIWSSLRQLCEPTAISCDAVTIEMWDFFKFLTIGRILVTLAVAGATIVYHFQCILRDWHVTCEYFELMFVNV